MIVRNFYAPHSSYNEFTSTDKITNLSTSDYPNLLDKTVDPLSAYYMGETPADKTLFNYEFEVDSTDEHNFVFKSESLHVKPKWLYGMASSTDQNLPVAWNGSRWIGAVNLINSMYPYYYNQFKTVTVSFILLVKNYSQGLAFTGTVYVCTASSSGVQLQFTPSELFEFFENGATKSIVIDGHAITFSISDWSEDGWFFDVGNDMRLYVQTIEVTTTEQTGHYYPQSGMKFYGMQTIGTADADNNKIGCIYGQSCNYYTYPDINIDFTSTFNLRTSSYTSDASMYTVTNGDKWFGNIRPFEIGQDACDYCQRQHIEDGYTNNRLLLPDDTLIRYTGTSGSSYFVGINKDMCNFLGWYQTLFCLLPKIVTDKTASGTTVVDPDTYSNVYNSYNAVPVFENNVPTGHLVKKETYSQLQPLLMNWQEYGMNINDNEYDPDAPEPEPGDDTPGDEPQGLPHDDGLPPELQKNRTISVPALFITQYALTARELETVGLHLWTSWLTPNSDVHLNFFLPYAADFGTLNIASCMDFIISLKVFPFEFPLDILLANNNGVRMGTGHTDFLGSATTYIKTQIYCLDVGECEVKLPEPYNDFRDIYNCTALCFMPYCGSVELNLAEILGRTLKASYFIDFQSGGCTCVIECAGDAGDYVIASKTGQIGFTLPMTATNAGQVAAQFMGDAVKFIGTASSTVFDIVGKAKDVAINIAGVNQGAQNGMDFDYAQSKADYYNAKGDIGIMQSATNGGIGVANQVLDMLSRSAVEMPMLSGGGSAESFMFADCVSIQIRRGKYKKPDNYPHSVGYYNLSSNTIESYKGAYSGSPSTGSTTGKGLCMFTNVDTSGLDCRQDERDEIMQLLSSGIYL